MTSSIRPPWVLVDDYTVHNSIDLLQRLTAWLESGDTAAARCANALSLDETRDPITIANWADALALALEHYAAAGIIDPELNR